MLKNKFYLILFLLPLFCSLAAADDDDSYDDGKCIAKAPGGNGMTYFDSEDTTHLDVRKKPGTVYGIGAHGGSFGAGTDLPMDEFLRLVKPGPGTKLIFMETCNGCDWAPEIASAKQLPVLAPNDTLWMFPTRKKRAYSVQFKGSKKYSDPDKAFSIYFPDGRVRPVNAHKAMGLFNGVTYLEKPTVKGSLRGQAPASTPHVFGGFGNRFSDRMAGARDRIAGLSARVQCAAGKLGDAAGSYAAADARFAGAPSMAAGFGAEIAGGYLDETAGEYLGYGSGDGPVNHAMNSFNETIEDAVSPYMPSDPLTWTQWREKDTGEPAGWVPYHLWYKWQNPEDYEYR